MIWLDAFSSRHLDPQKTPFIWELAGSGLHTNLEPLFAFAGIGASAFTGTSVNTHKIWCDYVFRESGHSPIYLKWLLRLCDIVPHDIMSQYARYVICRILGHNPGTPNLIPIELMDFFKVKERKRLTDERPIEGTVTLFEQLRRQEVRYFVSGLYESVFEKQITKSVLKAMTVDYRFILFRLGSPDKLGHKYGPESEEVTKRLGEIDARVKEIVTEGTRINPSTYFVVFSDHGMVPVREHVDLMNILERLPVKIGQDYIVFLNSTVANLWFRNQKAKDLIMAELSKVEQGMILDKPKLKKLGIDGIGPEYGDSIFALKEGSVFFPDFYRRRKPPKGMHGYAFAVYDKPPLIIYSPASTRNLRLVAKAEFIDVMPTLLDLLEIPIPSTCEGKSLLKSQTG